MNNISDSDFDSICSYLFWARLDGKDLNVTLTDEARNYCAAYGDTNLYTVSYGVDKLW